MATMSVSEFAAAEHRRLVPDPPAGFRRDLSGLGDAELLALAGSLPRSSYRRAAALDLLVARYRKLVASCVQRYSRSPQPTEDLMQAGYVGLLKAISNFDPALGFSLAAYAVPCITGELKRHFRDKSWPLRVGRQLQERVLDLRQAEQLLTQQLGRVPTDAELAGDLGVGAGDVREARQAELVLQPMSLDEPVRGQPGAASLADLLGAEDPRLEHLLGMQAIAAHWSELPVREQQIMVAYYYRGLTQTQIGQQLGVSQMQVSRLLARALSYLRPRLLGQPQSATETVPDPAPRTGPPAAAARPRLAGRPASGRGGALAAAEPRERGG
jgi:RNA polymerase sigma-B factor